MPTNFLASRKTWILNYMTKRLLLASFLIVIIMLSNNITQLGYYKTIFDYSNVVKNTLTTMQSYDINVVKPLSTTSHSNHNLLNFGPEFSNNLGLLNSTTAIQIEKSHEEEIAAFIAKNPLAFKNKGVYLPLSTETRNKIWQVNKDRTQRVKDVCRIKKIRKKVTLENLKKIKQYTNVVIDDKHKLLYCYIPKVGCTSWKVKLSLQNSKQDAEVLNTHPSPVDTDQGLAKHGIKMLNKYTLEEIKYRMENYFKFVFVRHPMERIVSSYRSKFEKRSDNSMEWPQFYKKYGDIIKHIAQKGKSYNKSDITFEEFVTYVVQKSGFEALTDHHWEQYNKLCHMCLIEYDFIGKFNQNLVDDISYVLRKIYDDERDCWFPNVTAPRSATKYLEKYFSKIPASLIDRLEEGYSLDFEMFNFKKGLSAKLNKRLS